MCPEPVVSLRGSGRGNKKTKDHNEEIKVGVLKDGEITLIISVTDGI